MRRSLRFAGLCLILAASELPAWAAPLFSGSAVIAFMQDITFGTADVTGLILSDTPDGMKFSGQISFNLTAPPAPTSTSFFITARRDFHSGIAVGTEMDLLAELTATVTNNGPSGPFLIGVNAFNRRGGCAGVAVTGSPVSGAVAEGPDSATCNSGMVSVGVPVPRHALFLQLAVGITHTGAGTTTIDLGNSALAEATAVPEPSTLWLLLAGASLIPLGVGRRCLSCREDSIIF